MEPTRFDRMSKLLARRRSRHVMAQDATPELPAGGGGSDLLFVQTFRAGAITPKDGAEGRFTLTLEAGTGQTVYFSDRPNRRVGATSTGEFLDRLGFPVDNPPNAALVIETAPGETDVAVVELFAPTYDEATGGVTYEVEVLANWQAELGVGLVEAPVDLATIEPSFGAAHLFIDGLADCPDGDIVCKDTNTGEVRGTIQGWWFDNFCSHILMFDPRNAGLMCIPCTTSSEAMRGSGGNHGDPMNVARFWGARCNEMFSSCNGNCWPSGFCRKDPTEDKVCPVPDI
jgi:hypothetical protein